MRDDGGRKPKQHYASCPLSSSVNFWKKIVFKISKALIQKKKKKMSFRFGVTNLLRNESQLYPQLAQFIRCFSFLVDKFVCAFMW